MLLYHGGTEIIEKPIIIPSLASRDFGTGFYCTDIRNQAEKWALQKLVFMPANNQYSFCSDNSLVFLKFDKSVLLD